MIILRKEYLYYEWEEFDLSIKYDVVYISHTEKEKHMKSLKAMITGLFLVGCTSSVTYETISAKDAKEMMGTQDVVILDVREESEYQQGHIREAQLIPLSQIQENNQELPDKDQTVLVYCRSGSRSAKAAQKLVKLGYTHVYDFGGINDWPYEIEK